MGVRPYSAIIMINDDLTPNVKDMLIRQLFLSEMITKAEWESRLALNSLYPTLVRRDGKRLAVLSSHQELRENRDVFDLVLFVKSGMISVEENFYGPPRPAFPIVNLYWGQFGIF